jgi:hypothetical protein
MKKKERWGVAKRKKREPGGAHSPAASSGLHNKVNLSNLLRVRAIFTFNFNGSLSMARRRRRRCINNAESEQPSINFNHLSSAQHLPEPAAEQNFLNTYFAT